MNILVTGAAGFIGFHLVKRLIMEGHDVVGIDNVNNYYDIELKYARLHECGIHRIGIGYGQYVGSSLYPKYRFMRMDIIDLDGVMRLFSKNKFDVVCHFAALAESGFPAENPHHYVHANIEGFLNVIEACRTYNSPHFIYAGSGAIYGNSDLPLKESIIDHPSSVYAVTKRCNELMAQTYGKVYGLRSTGLRFFSVYGPWARPDLAPYRIMKAVREGAVIEVFDNGNSLRDFTYIDDAIDGVMLTIDQGPDLPGDARVYNIANGSPVRIADLITAIEHSTGRRAHIRNRPMRKGEAKAIYVDISKMNESFGYLPRYTVEQGVAQQYEWCCAYERVYVPEMI